MNFTLEKLKEARDAGIPDDVIWEVASETEPKFLELKQNNIPIDIAIEVFQGGEPEPSGTSFGEEVSQLGSAFVESIGRPLENMGESFESFGFSGVANALKGAITEPENYVSAGQRFMEPAPDEAQLMGFAWQYAPRAAVEQVGQVIGSIGTRAVGAGVGGAVAGPPGAIAGGFLGPAVFGAAQVIGPVAKERAMNNGREVPNNSDLVAATLTAIGSGSLDAIGAQFLPGGRKAAPKFFKKVASAFVGEGLLTEAPQSVIEQIGATAGTEKGLNINVKQAVGEGLIGGTSAAGLTAIVSPFSKPVENQVIRTPEEAEELDIDSKANQEAVLLMGDPADQTQNERVTKLKEIESVIANNETLMTGLEPNAPERSKLDLENRVAKKEAEKLKAEITQGAGLSETITEAERQQIELAKAITAPAAPTVKESLTVPPAPKENVVTPTKIAPLPQRTIEESIQNKDTFEFEGMRGAVYIEDGATVFRPFGTNDKYEVPINPNQFISEIEGIQWVRKGQARQAPVEPTIPEVAAIVESQPQITEEEFNSTEDDFQLPQSLIEIEKSPTLNAIADIFNTGESKIVQEGKRKNKVSATPEFYRQITLEQIDVANRQIDNALRIIDNLPVSEDQKQTLAEPYLLIDQDISSYENNPEYKQYKASIRRQVRPTGKAVAFPETISEVAAGVKELEQRQGITKPAPAITPAPVAETPAVTEAPAAEVAKPTGGIDYYKQLGEQDALDSNRKKKRAVPQNFKLAYEVGWSNARKKLRTEPTPAVSETITPAAGISVGNRIKLGKSPQTYIVEEVVPQSEVEKANDEQYYSVKNEKTGEVQVVEKADMKQVKKSADIRKTVVGDTQYQTEGVIPEDQRFTEDELRVIVNDIFDGKIPDKIEIITDATDPNKEFKAAYSIRRGTITYNLAYLAKGDDLRFVTNHELGHFILGDPKFQKEMARLFDTLPTDIQEKLKNAIDEAYAQEGLGVRAEETIVFAFGEILENAPDGRNILQRFLDAIRDAINRLFKTEGYIPRNPKKAAAAILLAARNKFERGEFIRRPNGSILMMTPTSPKDVMRDAEYLATVERGDMETAQRMVDEAAKAAGYDSPKVYHGTDEQFNQFDINKVGSNFGLDTYGFFFTTNKDSANRSRKTYPQKSKFYFNEQDKAAAKSGRIISAYLNLGGVRLNANDIPNFASEGGVSAINTYDANRENVEKAAKEIGADSFSLRKEGDTFFAVYNPEQIKSADPVTYDDEGNVIPLSQRFQPSEPDIRRMAVRRTEIMAVEAGEEVDSPEGIIAKTKALLRKQFDPTKVSKQNTTEAFRALGRLTGKDGTAFAQELNDIGRVVDESGAASEISMGAALFINDLFEYSIRLAAEGNKKLLGIMLTNINKLPTAAIGVSDAARALRARLELSQRFLTMGQAEQDAYTNYVAEFIYGPNPTKEQIKSIKDAYAAVEKTPQVTEQELTDEIKAVGDRSGTDLVGKINEEFTKATEKGGEKRRTEEQELDREYKKVQRQADAEIEKLAKIQSDTPSFDPAVRQIINEVRAIVANDLKQRPDMESKTDWKSALIAKLQQVGVELTAAETLADIVWRQHEINNLSRELSSINKAIEKGPISEIVKAIKNTPLEDQQNPNWRYEVMRDYLRRAGLNVAQSERIAKLMDISLQKRFTMAQEQAFTDAISKTAPWKAGDTRSRRAFQKVLQALRAGALDPARNVLSDMAALNGWTGFSPEQYKALLKNDAILADPESGELQKSEAYKAIQDIISKAKLPIRARDVIGQYYDAQALNGIPTFSVNSFSPIAFAMRNAIVEASSGAIKGDAKAIGRAATALVDSIKSWANTVAFSFKNNVTVYSNVDYIVNDDNLLRLYRKGVDQFTKSKNAKERADGVKNMMIGMMDYVRRILNALDYGAIAALQNQNISKYAMAVMKNKGMNNKQANEVFAAMMKAKNDFYLEQIAIGTDKNKASILADEFYISSWKKSLEKEGVAEEEIKSAMDAAINDALSSVGRNRQSLDALKGEATKLKDAGMASSPALWLLESVANAANRSDSQFIKVFSRVIYGFAIVPARVIRETAWFSPYGFVRLAVDAGLKNRNIESRYAQSLGSDFQRQQRFNEAAAGTIALFALMALRAGSTDDPEDEDEFKIVFTGNGPQRKDDPQFYDSWYKAGNKPNSMIVSFGKTKFTLNMMRGFEAFTWPAMMLGAVDDLEIRKKQKQKTNTPAEIEDAAIVAGFVFDAALRRGPYAFTTKSLFGTYGDIGVEGVAKGLTFPAKTLIPVLGTSLASNISNFLNDPIDRRTLDGAVWSNVPFIGPAVAPKSLNAFGEPSLSTDFASKMFKLGVPIVYDIPTDRQSVMLHELVLKQGGGPSIPTRNQLAQRLDREPTNKEYEMFVKEYGTVLTNSMKKNYDRLFNAKAEFYSKAVERIGNRARDIAENKVRQAAKKP